MLKGRVGYPPAALPRLALSPAALCGWDAAISQMLCSQPTHMVLGDACCVGAAGLDVAIITCMMQGNACVNEHT